MTFSIKLIIIVLSIRMLKLAKGFYGCKTKEMHIWNYSLYPMQVRRNAYLKLLSISHALKLLLAHSALSKNHMLHAQQGDQSNPLQVQRNAYLKLLSISHALKLLLAHPVLSKNHMLHAQQDDQMTKVTWRHFLVIIW